jgi:membrane glycosyltransferase
MTGISPPTSMGLLVKDTGEEKFVIHHTPFVVSNIFSVQITNVNNRTQMQTVIETGNKILIPDEKYRKHNVINRMML